MPKRKIRNIWIFNHYAISPDLPGGTRHYDIASELVKRGYQVTIFAAGFSHRERRELKGVPGEKWMVENVNGVNFVWVKTFAYYRNNWRRFANMLSFMTRAGRLAGRLPAIVPGTDPPDLVIGSSVHLFAVAAAQRTAKHFRARFFMEVRDIWPQTLIDMNVMGRNHPAVLAMRWLERRLYKQADFILTPLPFASSYLESQGFDRGRVHFLPQGTFIKPLENRLPNKERDAPFTVIYAGSLGWADHLETLVKAGQFLGDGFKLLFYGEGEAKDSLVALAKKLHLNNVAFSKPVPKSEVLQLLARADALMVHVGDLGVRKKYGMALNKLVDYLAAAKPIVFAGDIPNDVVGEVGCGISVRPADPKAVAQAIERLRAMDAGERYEMGARARRYLAANHAIPILVDGLEKLWEPDPAIERPSIKPRSGTTLS